MTSKCRALQAWELVHQASSIHLETEYDAKLRTLSLVVPSLIT